MFTTTQQRLEQHQARGRTITLKIKFGDYQQITRSKTLPDYIGDIETIIATATALFEAVELKSRSIRLLGISLSNLENGKQTQVIQLPLFSSSGIIFSFNNG
ncbi:hypothetical protein [Anabaena sp. CCY 9910]|uniref:DinB/UmuC family translesion DNA polymerase n=1 Tax=Anabaena sp. CCY 9910 TaxID=3103870 RepID=UPI0039DFA8CD